MRDQMAFSKSRSAGGAGRNQFAARPAADSHGTLCVRNYDRLWSYDLDVEVTGPDGQPVFQKRYYLGPNRTVTEPDVPTPDELTIRSTLDNGKQRALTRESARGVGPMAVIEVGNGAISLTDGRFA